MLLLNSAKLFLCSDYIRDSQQGFTKGSSCLTNLVASMLEWIY